MSETRLTDAPFSPLRRPAWFRRALHVQNPAPGGRRQRHGGTTTPWGFRKGDWVEATKAGRPILSVLWSYRPHKKGENLMSAPETSHHADRLLTATGNPNHKTQDPQLPFERDLRFMAAAP